MGKETPTQKTYEITPTKKEWETTPTQIECGKTATKKHPLRELPTRNGKIIHKMRELQDPSKPGMEGETPTKMMHEKTHTKMDSDKTPTKIEGITKHKVRVEKKVTFADKLEKTRIIPNRYNNATTQDENHHEHHKEEKHPKNQTEQHKESPHAITKYLQQQKPADINIKHKTRRGPKGTNPEGNLNILYANANGIRGKMKSIHTSINIQNSDIIIICETKGKPPKMENHIWYEKTRTGNNGGGIAIAISKEY